jgi:uncharacterized protein HemX
MNKLSDKLNAAPRASMLVRVSVGALAVAGLLGAVLPASAQSQQQPRKEERDPRQFQQRQERGESSERDPRSFESRAEAHRRMLQDSTNNAETSRRVGRMTADERRDLRRQINEAGAEVYALPGKR